MSTPLASSLVADVAVDSTGVYWTAAIGLCPSDADAGVVSLAMINGSYFTESGEGGDVTYGPVDLTTGLDGATPLGPSVDGGSPFFLCAGTVNRLPLVGGQPSILAIAQGLLVGSVTVGPSNVFWSTSDSSGNQLINSVPKAGGTPVLVTLGPVNAMAATDRSVVLLRPGPFEVDGDVEILPLGGGDAVTIASDQNNPTAVAIDNTNIYWADEGTSARCYTDGAIVRAPLAGGRVETLVTGEFSPEGIAIDDTSVYWVTRGDSRGGMLRKLTPK